MKWVFSNHINLLAWTHVTTETKVQPKLYLVLMCEKEPLSELQSVLSHWRHDTQSRLHVKYHLRTYVLYVRKQWKLTSFSRQTMRPPPKWECVWLRCDRQMTISQLITASHTQWLDTVHKHKRFFASTNENMACFNSICFQTALKWSHYMSNMSCKPQAATLH